MNLKTKIEWTDVTWNPVSGCSKVSSGCKNCYAERIANRFWKNRKFTDVQIHKDRLLQPYHWKEPRKIFVNSMSDLFHEKVTDSFIEQVFGTIVDNPRHIFQVLTKRPERMKKFIDGFGIQENGYILTLDDNDSNKLKKFRWPLKNLWLGVSVEDQKTADERIPLLARTLAEIRFVSYEPALEFVDFWKGEQELASWIQNIDWLIMGGESGLNARPMNPDWVKKTLKTCQYAGVPFFFKQWGEWHHSYEKWFEKFKGKNYYDWKRSEHFVFNNGNGNYEKMWKVGKNIAGNLIDGKKYEQFPVIVCER